MQQLTVNRVLKPCAVKGSSARIVAPRSARPCVMHAARHSAATAPQSESQHLLDRRQGLLAAVTLAAGAVPSAPVLAAGEMQTARNGLQFMDEVEGSGPSPVKGARVRAHYTGKLASNGAVFDSSYDRGQPLAFPIGQGVVIKGWDLGIIGSTDEGIPPMKEGGKRKLIIPPELGYGSRGVGPIPPNSALEFDVYLVKAR